MWPFRQKATGRGVLSQLMDRRMITTRLSQGAKAYGILGRCAMFFSQLRSRFIRVVPIVLLSTFAFAASKHSQVNSGAAGIFLRAVLVQSLRMNVLPEPTIVNSLIASVETPKFPVTIKTNWVRGSANISIAVFASQDFQSWHEAQRIAVLDPSQKHADQPLPEFQFSSADLQISGDDSKVLTIRAQAL
jgi:hypothetical protein